MINIYSYGYSIDVTPPFNTRLIYGQQFFLFPTIVAFCWRILAAMVSNWMQTIVVLLQQYSIGSIMTCICIDDKQQLKIRQLQSRRIAQKFSKLVKCAILISTPIPRSLWAGKISKQSSNISIMTYVLCIIMRQAKELLKLFDRGRFWLSTYDLHLVRVCANTTRLKDMP